MTSHYYVVPFHVIPLFDRHVHLSHYLPILSFIPPTSSCYYVVILSFVSLLFQCPIDVLLEMKGCKTFTGMKISFWTGQHVYQYSSSCGFMYLTSFMRFCPNNQCIFWFRAGCIENIPNVRAQIMGQLHHRMTDTMQWEEVAGCGWSEEYRKYRNGAPRSSKMKRGRKRGNNLYLIFKLENTSGDS